MRRASASLMGRAYHEMYTVTEGLAFASPNPPRPSPAPRPTPAPVSGPPGSVAPGKERPPLLRSGSLPLRGSIASELKVTGLDQGEFFRSLSTSFSLHSLYGFATQKSFSPAQSRARLHAKKIQNKRRINPRLLHARENLHIPHPSFVIGLCQTFSVPSVPPG